MRPNLSTREPWKFRNNLAGVLDLATASKTGIGGVFDTFEDRWQLLIQDVNGSVSLPAIPGFRYILDYVSISQSEQSGDLQIMGTVTSGADIIFEIDAGLLSGTQVPLFCNTIDSGDITILGNLNANVTLALSGNTISNISLYAQGYLQEG